MALQSWCRTDVGRRRESNQDSYLINADMGLYVVADGMGGHQGGEVASALAVEALEDVIRNSVGSTSSPRDQFLAAYTEACRRIFDKAAYERPELLGMGTTMVAILHRGTSFLIGNVGDSRCYLYRKPHFWQVTEDHSMVNEQLRAGLINEHQALHFSGRNVITRSVGYEREVAVDILERPATKGDVFLLCSDGLSGLVTDQKIADIFNQNPLSEVANKCVDAALGNGGDDNVTVLVVANVD